MSLAIRAMASVIIGGSIVSAAAVLIPERFEAVLYWSLPAFHKVFAPWAAGPNPKAAICALALDLIVLAAIAFVSLSAWSCVQRQSLKRRDPSRF
jgi:membrane protein implicated in regulation of membrane protease activity